MKEEEERKSNGTVCCGTRAAPVHPELCGPGLVLPRRRPPAQEPPDPPQGLCWRTTARAAGAERSVALLSLIFAAGAVSTTTNVTFFPFVGRFPKQYTTALTLGQGLAGVLFGGLGVSSINHAFRQGS